MGWPRLVVDLFASGVLNLFDSLDEAAFDALVSVTAAARGLPLTTPAVVYVDASPLIYRVASTTMKAATLEIWTGLFLLDNEFSSDVKEDLVRQWADPFATALFAQISRLVPLSSGFVREVVVLFEHRVAHALQSDGRPPAGATQSEVTSFRRNKNTVKSASTWLSHLLKSLQRVPEVQNDLFRESVRSRNPLRSPFAHGSPVESPGFPPPTMDASLSKLARAGVRLPDWFLVPVMRRLRDKYPSKFVVRLVDGIADEAAAAEGKHPGHGSESYFAAPTKRSLVEPRTTRILRSCVEPSALQDRHVGRHGLAGLRCRRSIRPLHVSMVSSEFALSRSRRKAVLDVSGRRDEVPVSRRQSDRVCVLGTLRRHRHEPWERHGEHRRWRKLFGPR